MSTASRIAAPRSAPIFRGSMDAKKPSPAQEPLSLATSQQGEETILIVEDEINLRRLARQYLETQGYRILEAEDGAAALQIVDGHKGTIDLLLTDVIMPGMNGRELSAHITRLLPDVRVLYMSGYTENAIGHDGTWMPASICCRNHSAFPL